jgi:hypothetical protein
VVGMFVLLLVKPKRHHETEAIEVPSPANQVVRDIPSDGGIEVISEGLLDWRRRRRRGRRRASVML